jgi:type I restriction enzyme S subunit
MTFESARFGDLFLEPQRNGLTRPKKVRGTGLPMVNMGELFAHPRILNLKMDLVPVEEKDRHYLLKAGDLLFARQSLVLSGAGQCSVFVGNSAPTVFESHLIRCRLDAQRSNPHFYFYFFRSPEGRRVIEAIVEQGAGASGVRGSDLINVLVPNPLKEVQDNIAMVLGALDDRITLLRETNATLEAIAQALFKSWFVDFDPVRAKMAGRAPEGMDEATAALFPDALEETELGVVPKGWLVGCLGDVAKTFKKAMTAVDLHEGVNYVGLEHIPRKSLSLTEWGDAAELASNKAAFSEGDILFGKLRPYFHKVVVAPVSGVCSTDILVCQPTKPEHRGVATMHLSSEALISYADRLSNGAKMPRVNWSDLAKFPITAPPLSISAAYTSAVEPLLSRMSHNAHAARTLASLRDTLLPRLISGQLRLPEAQTQLEDALA